MNNNPIGVYDSGFGGLSVWRELYRALPEESIVYLGDGKNCPYGSLSAEKIRDFATKSVEELLAKGCKMIVVACNTATAAAIDHLRAAFPEVPFVGLEPAVKPAALSGGHPNVVVMATPMTLREQKFQRLIARFQADADLLVFHGNS